MLTYTFSGQQVQPSIIQAGQPIYPVFSNLNYIAQPIPTFSPFFDRNRQIWMSPIQDQHIGYVNVKQQMQLTQAIPAPLSQANQFQFQAFAPHHSHIQIPQPQQIIQQQPQAPQPQAPQPLPLPQPQQHQQQQQQLQQEQQQQQQQQLLPKPANPLPIGSNGYNIQSQPFVPKRQLTAEEEEMELNATLMAQDDAEMYELIETVIWDNIRQDEEFQMECKAYYNTDEAKAKTELTKPILYGIAAKRAEEERIVAERWASRSPIQDSDFDKHYYNFNSKW